MLRFHHGYFLMRTTKSLYLYFAHLQLHLKIGFLFSNEVYVFTPEGRVIPLQRGSTPVDFAYAVHTDIGDHCSAAKINGKIVSLQYKLKNGDRVEIKTAKTQRPNRHWLSSVKTSKARGKILHFINSIEKEKSLSLGTALLYKSLAEHDDYH